MKERTWKGLVVDRPSRQTAADEAEAAVFDAIMAGTIAPGSQLRLQDLAQQLGMSIMPVREAIRRLEGFGLIDIVAHKGAWVRPLTVGDLYDTYFTRLNLECLALRVAAPRFSAAHAADARAALHEHLAAVARNDLVASRDAHERFHFALYEACGSEWLVRSIGPTWRNSERYRVKFMRHPTHRVRRAEEHAGMLDALIAHDAATAVRLLERHLKYSVEVVAAGLRSEGGDEDRRELPDISELLAEPVAPSPAAENAA